MPVSACRSRGANHQSSIAIGCELYHLSFTITTPSIANATPSYFLPFASVVKGTSPYSRRAVGPYLFLQELRYLCDDKGAT